MTAERVAIFRWCGRVTWKPGCGVAAYDLSLSVCPVGQANVDWTDG